MADSPGYRTGAEVLAAMLSAYGVTHFFMVPSVFNLGLMEMERRTNIVRVHAHGEKAAAYMADGYARASGRPGVCAAQVVGALNLAAGLRDAHLAHSPVIALTGGRHPRLKFKRVYQEVDDVPAFEQVTKFNATVDDVTRFPDMIRQAFRSATTGCPGPVHLQFQGNEGQIDAESGPMEPVVETRFARVPPFRPGPDDADVAAALAQLRAARRPVLVVGGGARMSAAGTEVIRVAEALQIPLATSLNGKQLVPASHPLSVGVVGSYSRESANQVVAAADLVCFVGSEAGGMVTAFWTLPRPGTTVVQIDIDAASLGRNYPLAAAVNGDAKVTLRRLLELNGDQPAPARGEWLDRVRGICADWRATHAALIECEDVPIRPERLASELSRLVPDNAAVVVDTGHSGVWMGGYFDITSAEQRYIRSCGHLGWAFPAGLGVKCAAPDRPVVVFTGDSGMWYHIAEIETAVRWKINTITVVNNNSGGSQTRNGYNQVYEDQGLERSSELWAFNGVDFAKIAEDMGAVGLRVDKPAELEPAMARALAADGPVVINVRTDPDILAPRVGS
ncbi:MAG: thiamine pyrophosphate-binding protein [Streptosporangiaceae bacterium]